MSDPLVSTSWLREHLNDSDVRIVDAAYRMPAMRPPTASEEYAARHIPGAVFFDVDQVADRGSSLPHMLPPPEQFARDVGALGIGNDDLVVIYDRGDYMGAPRAWWMFGVFGHDRVKVLDGGLNKWVAESGAVESKAVAPTPKTYQARFDASRVRSLEDVRKNVEARAEQVIDARSRERYEGTAPEPWAGRRSGRIPGSLNVPFTDVIDPATGEMRPASELWTIFQAARADLGRPIVTSCGSGVTAGVLSLALARLGIDSALYDGSWAEWGLPDGPPVATGKP
jgi:thiosulfate/3-mercaptopyruvate sulfurtransferase